MSIPRVAAVVLGTILAATAARADDGVVPTAADGRPLNLGFEAGDLSGWTATGDAFNRALVEGDVVHARRADMRSGHEGRFWVGSYEQVGDPATGTLTSAPFKLTKPFASFLVGGGFHPETRVEIVRASDGLVLFKSSGEQMSTTEGNEELKRVAVDLSKEVGQNLFVRVVDQHKGHWGHVNYDDFRLHDTMPALPPRAKPAVADSIAHDGLSPQDAARAMTVPEGFAVTLFAGEPDVVQPIAMAIDDRGRLWVAEAYSYPHRVAPELAKDRILIFEDVDGDGKFDTRKVFADKLNLVSGLEVGFGGAWVGAAPNLLFLPDKDGDDRADGPPQTLLDGWGLQDTHETPNTLSWGPDGWLYGCHGVFTFSNVGKPGTPDSQRTPLNAGVWRYHPTKHRFEVVAHGTSNPWGIDWDAKGQAFITACVIPHLYQIIPGGRYERQAGPHYNPYTYDDIKTIADHRHYVGDNPHAANGKSGSMGGGHAHCGAMIYQGGAWPAEYNGQLFMNNIHGARLNRDVLKPYRSGYIGSHAPDFLMANDSWSQIVSLKSGPDGQLYMIDWYDKNQCHRVEDGAHDRTNGRIFKVSYTKAKPLPRRDLAKLEAAELVTLLGDSNEFNSRHARRILQERAADQPRRRTRQGEPSTGQVRMARAVEAADPKSAHERLRWLWATHVVGSLDDETILQGLLAKEPEHRAWTIQLAVDDSNPSQKVLDRFAGLAHDEPSPVVRLALVAAMQRVPLAQRWDVLEALCRRSEDVGDPNIPLMLWYAAEPLAEVDAARALKLATASPIDPLPSFMTRRVAAIGTPEAITLLVVEGVRKAPNSAARLVALRAMNRALEGRRQVDMPTGWPETFDACLADTDAEVRGQASALAVTFGDPAALRSLRGVLVDPKAGANPRREALASLLKARVKTLAPDLQKLLADPDLRGEALRGLSAFDDTRTPSAVLAIYPILSVAERRDALNTLSARADFARPMLAAVGKGDVPRADLSADLIRQLRNLKSPEVDSQIAEVWGAARDSSADKVKSIARMKALLTSKPKTPPDVNLGRSVFAKTCSQCHTLFAVGGKVGPELTGSNRADLDYVLSNVYDPSSLIGKDYLAHVVATADGRVLTGIVRAEDKDAITLVTANETLVLPKADIEARRPSDQSMMPEDLWQPLDEHQVRSVVAYLASPGQVPSLATPDNASTFFDGKTLAGWVGDPSLWSVQGGEIVGKTKGLARNEFLCSDMIAQDFVLTLKVKLVANEGNSGVQFRSAALADGEMRGDQADVGPGWWGKLYEENGRGLLWKESAEAAVKLGEWNEYVIKAVGSKVETRINGVKAADLDDPAGARRGIFGLQLHSGGPTEVRFKDLRLEVIR